MGVFPRGAGVPPAISSEGVTVGGRDARPTRPPFSHFGRTQRADGRPQYPAGASSRSYEAKVVYLSRKLSLILPVGPFRCLPTMISAVPWSGSLHGRFHPGR